MSEDVEREIGRHSAQIEGLEARMERVEGKLDKVLAVLSEARGGWKTLLMVAGAAGAMGAFLGKLVPWVPWK